MGKQIIVVIGATGNQGASVVDSFLPLASKWHIRAVTRQPNSPRAQILARKGCEVVKADTGDIASLVAAFKGAKVIFAVTDYWAPFWKTEGLDSEKPIRIHCHDEELRHGINMAKAAASPEVLESLTHYIWSCTSSPRKWSGGKYQEIYHFESKAAITEWIKSNEPQLASKMSTIQVSFYASNRPDGTFTIDRLTPADKKHPFIATRWDTGPFVKILTEKDPGKTLLAYTSMISFSQLAAMWSRATGENAVYRQTTLKELQEQFPEEGEEGTMSDMYSNDFGYHGGDPHCLMPMDVGIEDRPDVIERWLNQADWDAVMGSDWREMSTVQ